MNRVLARVFCPVLSRSGFFVAIYHARENISGTNPRVIASRSSLMALTDENELHRGAFENHGLPILHGQLTHHT